MKILCLLSKPKEPIKILNPQIKILGLPLYMVLVIEFHAYVLQGSPSYPMLKWISPTQKFFQRLPGASGAHLTCVLISILCISIHIIGNVLPGVGCI